MIWRVDVANRTSFPDASSREAGAALREAGLEGEVEIRAGLIYLLEGELDRPAAERVARELLHDPVVQEYTLRPGAEPPVPPAGTRAVLVFRRPGVMDPVEESAIKAVADLGLEVRGVTTGRRYLLRGGPPDNQLREAFAGALANEAIEEITIGERAFPEIDPGAPYTFRLTRVPVRNASDEELAELNRKMALALTPEELRRIREEFVRLDRDPTDVELETLAQTWSEHCKHKTFSGDITFRGETIRNLLKSTVFKATRDLKRPWCVSVFKDNAGIIEFDDTTNVCFKVETHNHPSAIEPYGGSNTGLGGVIRDVLGCGLGARPICSTDVFCVGMPDAGSIPPGTIHPRRLLAGVVSGVRDYGNRMGIPTVNGAVFFDERYTGNPLVFCGTLGIMPKEASFKEAKKGDRVVVVGGRTGRDGIHGATFSSEELHEKSEDVSSGAVQIGNAIMEKRVLDTVLQARDRGLYTAITDCGAGGLSSAVGEMGEALGAEVDLEKVPLKYAGLSYSEIWISEAQERMVLAAPPDKVDELLSVFRAEDVEATVIGRFTGDGQLRLRYEGNLVADLEMEFVHHGIPVFSRDADYAEPRLEEPKLPAKKDYGPDLRRILSSWNVCSKEWIIRQYDHEVQGASVVKPLTGRDNDGPGDAAVIRPLPGSARGIAIGCGMNPRYGDLSPYAMAACAIDEAMRNVIAVGGDPERTALLDNFAWGRPDTSGNLGALVLASRACHDAAIAFGTPFISGKDSLNNEFRVGGKTVVIPHSLLISAVSIVGDVSRCVTLDAKAPGSRVYLVGPTRDELGGSHFYSVNGHVGANVPKVELGPAKEIFAATARAIREGTVLACHDLSEGGLAVAAAEMAFAGGFGMKLDLAALEGRDDVLLFSETPSRFLVEVGKGSEKRFESIMGKVPCFRPRTTNQIKLVSMQPVIESMILALPS
jgi:phosphoribosylformylglycinamidine synthase